MSNLCFLVNDTIAFENTNPFKHVEPVMYKTKEHDSHRIPSYKEPLYVADVQMSELKNRLRTFVGNESLFLVETTSLAVAGLYYTGLNDRVKCAFCKKQIEHWASEDNPLKEHRRISPQCSFVKKIFSVQRPQQNCSGTEQCSSTSSALSSSLPSSQSSSSVSSLLNRLNPSNPSLMKFDDRLQTFRRYNWSSHMSPSEMAAAGFFYSG